MKESAFAAISAEDEDLAHRIIGAAIEVHRVLGPGFLESVYQTALDYELKSRGLPVAREQAILVPYKDIQIEGQRLDLIVGDRIIVELKTVEAIAPVHLAQLLSYSKATGLRLGLLLNFKVPRLVDGIQRVVR